MLVCGSLVLLNLEPSFLRFTVWPFHQGSGGVMQQKYYFGEHAFQYMPLYSDQIKCHSVAVR